uniref:DNA polymerase delta subunit 3 n=1 Tax=Culex tarsalis TaxID=7177 RepID=A0A1Q3F085_CULTA
MDTAVEKSCLDEISHTVLDSKGKISVRTLSNNYEISFADAVKVLQRWIDANGSKAKLAPEFIVRGTDPKGIPFITVANEKRLKTIKAKAERVSSMLYALEAASESSRKLNVPVDQEFRAISLPLTAEKRDVKVFVPSETKAAPPVVKQEAKPKSIFGAAASSSKVAPKAVPKAEPAKAVAVKEEKQSPPAATTAVKKEPTPTKPAGSPTKVSPSKKKDAKKPVATGKSSIASFFSNKPAAAAKPAASKPAEKPVEKPAEVKVKEEKPSPKQESKKPTKEDETQRWKRMISDESSGDDEVIPNTPQDKKPEKKKGGRKPMTYKKGVAAAATSKANPSKKSRILQVEDSSEEEEDEVDRGLKEPEERLVAFEVEESDDAEMKDAKELSPEKPVENDASSANRGRAKVKKLVTKTFMDEEGYLTTIKEYQMVSASEDEGESEAAAATTNNNNNKAEPVANGKKEGSTGKGKSETKATDKKAASKVTPPTPKTKQGSIMSFFAKK